MCPHVAAEATIEMGFQNGIVEIAQIALKEGGKKFRVLCLFLKIIIIKSFFCFCNLLPPCP